MFVCPRNRNRQQNIILFVTMSVRIGRAFNFWARLAQPKYSPAALSFSFFLFLLLLRMRFISALQNT